MFASITTGVIDFFTKLLTELGDVGILLLSICLAVIIVAYYFVKVLFTYESRLSRALDTITSYLYTNNHMTEDNVKEFNNLMKQRAPKQLLHYWQQYILFREKTPSQYMSETNVIEKPLKASAFNANLKNMLTWTVVWAVFSASIVALYYSINNTGQVLQGIFMSLLIASCVMFIGGIAALIFRARKNANLNKLYRKLALFNRFIDNACQFLPIYIDYQLLFTAVEIEKGVPVLREFLDSRARAEKEEFEKNQALKEDVEKYNFESAGVDGSLVLDRAMAETEKFIKKKEKILALIAQAETELESRKKNFEGVQKDYQKRLQVSKENVDKLRQQQEETTNRIEGNYLRKQQSTEIAKQEQLEEELEKQTTKYVLDKNECENEIKKLNAELEESKNHITEVMLLEYDSFYKNVCKSTQDVVEKVIKAKVDKMTNEKDEANLSRADLEYKIVKLQKENKRLAELANVTPEQAADPAELKGDYDQAGNYVFENGTFYDTDGNYHDLEGNVYTQNGELLRTGEPNPYAKQVEDIDAPVDVENINHVFDDATRNQTVAMASGIAKDVMDIDVIDSNPAPEEQAHATIEKQQPQVETNEQPRSQDESHPEPKIEVEAWDGGEETTQELESAVVANEQSSQPQAKEEEPKQDDVPKKHPGRPRKEKTEEEQKPKGKRGRPKKVETQTEQQAEKQAKHPGRPRKVQTEEEEQKPKGKRGRPRKEPAAEVEKETSQPKGKRGRPRKIVDTQTPKQKQGRGRPKKSIENKIAEEEDKVKSANESINNEIENVLSNLTQNQKDEKRDQIMTEFENLKKEVDRVRNEGGSEEEIARLNTRIEELIAELTSLQ